MHLPLLVVPVPNVKVVSSTPNPILSGSSPTLTCTIELHPAVDIPVHITTVWTGPDGSKLTSAASPVMKSFTHYTSKITLNYIKPENSGSYTCNVSIKNYKEISADKEIVIGKLIESYY